METLPNELLLEIYNNSSKQEILNLRVCSKMLLQALPELYIHKLTHQKRFKSVVSAINNIVANSINYDSHIC